MSTEPDKAPPTPIDALLAALTKLRDRADEGYAIPLATLKELVDAVREAPLSLRLIPTLWRSGPKELTEAVNQPKQQ